MILDDYVDYIVQRQDSDEKQNMITFSFYTATDIISIDAESFMINVKVITKEWLIKRFDLALRYLSKMEEYNICVDVFKHLNKLKKIKE